MADDSFDHLHSPRRQWWLVIALAMLTLLCGTIGLWRYEHEHHPNAAHGLNPLYHAAQMLILHTPHFEHRINGWMEAGRWFGAGTLAFGTVALFWRRLRRECRFFQLSRWDGHSVICGLGAKGFEIVRCLKERNPEARVAVLDPKPDPNFAARCEDLGACVITHDASDSKVLQQARVAHAGEIVVITPTDEANVRIADAVREQCAKLKPGKGPACHIHLSDINLREELQKWCEPGARMPGGCGLHFFDVFDDEARRVLLDLPIDGPGIAPNDPCTVHAVILGFGRMGRSIALRAAKLGHFANSRPLRLSIVDRNAQQGRERFLFRHPALVEREICDLTFHEMEAESLTARKLIEQWAAEPNTLLHVFECLDYDALDLEVGLRLRTLLAGWNHCTLRVRFHSRHSLARILEASTEGGGLVPFGMVEDACCDDAFRREARDRLARAIHDRFAQRRQAGSQRTPENDAALRAWEMLAEDIRESNRQQADHMAIKLRAIGCELTDSVDPRQPVMKFAPGEVELMAEMEHRRWNAERWLAGWRYGTRKDATRRINPNIASWDELDDSIQEYDREIVRDIPQLLALLEPAKKVVRAEAKTRVKPAAQP